MIWWALLAAVPSDAAQWALDHGDLWSLERAAVTASDGPRLRALSRFLRCIPPESTNDAFALALQYELGWLGRESAKGVLSPTVLEGWSRFRVADPRAGERWITWPASHEAWPDEDSRLDLEPPRCPPLQNPSPGVMLDGAFDLMAKDIPDVIRGRIAFDAASLLRESPASTTTVAVAQISRLLEAAEPELRASGRMMLLEVCQVRAWVCIDLAHEIAEDQSAPSKLQVRGRALAAWWGVREQLDARGGSPRDQLLLAVMHARRLLDDERWDELDASIDAIVPLLDDSVNARVYVDLLYQRALRLTAEACLAWVDAHSSVPGLGLDRLYEEAVATGRLDVARGVMARRPGVLRYPIELAVREANVEGLAQLLDKFTQQPRAPNAFGRLCLRLAGPLVQLGSKRRSIFVKQILEAAGRVGDTRCQGYLEDKGTENLGEVVLPRRSALELPAFRWDVPVRKRALWWDGALGLPVDPFRE